MNPEKLLTRSNISIEFKVGENYLSNYYAYDLDSFRYISHHGILGQKWGVRRYQNPDGTLTNAGRKRYTKEIEKGISKQHKAADHKPHDAWEQAHKNVQSTKRAIRKEIESTQEYKKYKKAYDKVEAENDKMLNTFQKQGAKDFSYDYSKWNTLTTQLNRAEDAYNERIGKAFIQNKDRLLSAKLADIKVKDTKETRELLEEFYKKKWPKTKSIATWID